MKHIAHPHEASITLTPTPVNSTWFMTCNLAYHSRGFDWSSFAMVICASIFIVLLAKFGSIYSFKVIFRTKSKQQQVLNPINHQNYGTYKDDHIFQGFILGKKFAFLYLLLVAFAGLCEYAL